MILRLFQRNLSPGQLKMVADESDQTKPKSLVALIEFVEEGEREMFELVEVMTVIYS